MFGRNLKRQIGGIRQIPRRHDPHLVPEPAQNFTVLPTRSDAMML
ncbi:hypothetical protein [Chloroflexus aggregans]|nr:hypothetical protein [Chloroflexus aggregans]